MKKVTEPLKKIFGKWKITDIKNQHVVYHPDEDALSHLGEWKSFDIKKTEEITSNFLLCGIGKENLITESITDIQIEFTEIFRTELTYNCKIYSKDKILEELFWEISTEPDYCDLSIITDEVYNYARFKIEKLNDNELILLERNDNTESDTYFHRINLKKIEDEIFQTKDFKYKTIFFGKNEFIFSEEKIETSLMFNEVYKYPKLIKKTIKVRFDEIKSIKFDKDEMKINAYIKIKSLSFKKSIKLSNNDIESFKNQIEKLSHEKFIIKQNKFQILLNHHGVITVIAGILISYLIYNGSDFSQTQGKRKIYGYLIQKLIDTLGTPLSISLGVIITIFGIYSIWKKINEAYDDDLNKVGYKNLIKKC